MNNLEVLDSFIKDNSMRFSHETICSYHTAIKGFLSFCPKSLQEITKKDIKLWLTFLTDEGKKPRTIQLKLAALKAFFLYCLDEDLILKSPVLSIERPKEDDMLPRFLDKISLFKLRDVMKYNVRDRAILEVFLSSGVRVSELINILLEDIRWEKRQIWIRNGKGAMERFVLFNPDCAERIQEYLKKRKDDCPYLFVSYRNKPFTRQGVWKLIKYYVRKAGLENNVSPHTFRHSFASNLAEKGAPFNVIADLLGHKDMNTTRIYSKFSVAARKRKYEEHR